MRCAPCGGRGIRGRGRRRPRRAREPGAGGPSRGRSGIRAGRGGSRSAIPPCGHGHVPEGDEHGLRGVRRLSSRVTRGGLQERGGAAPAEAPQRHGRVHQGGTVGRQGQDGRRHGDQQGGRDRQGAQVAVDQCAHDPDARQGRGAEDEQHEIGGAPHADSVEERRDERIEDGVGEDEDEGDEEDRGHAGDAERPEHRRPRSLSLSWLVGDGRGDPAEEGDGEDGHAQERDLPVHGLAEERARGNAQGQCDRDARHRDRDGPALEVGGREAPGVAGEQRPGQACSRLRPRSGPPS